MGRLLRCGPDEFAGCIHWQAHNCSGIAFYGLDDKPCLGLNAIPTSLVEAFGTLAHPIHPGRLERCECYSARDGVLQETLAVAV